MSTIVESKVYERICELRNAEEIYNALAESEELKFSIPLDNGIISQGIIDKKVIDIIRSYYAQLINGLKLELNNELAKVLPVNEPSLYLDKDIYTTKVGDINIIDNKKERLD